MIFSPRHPIILGLSWLEMHTPTVDWRRSSVDFTSRIGLANGNFEANGISLQVVSLGVDHGANGSSQANNSFAGNLEADQGTNGSSKAHTVWLVAWKLVRKLTVIGSVASKLIRELMIARKQIASWLVAWNLVRKLTTVGLVAWNVDDGHCLKHARDEQSRKDLRLVSKRRQ